MLTRNKISVTLDHWKLEYVKTEPSNELIMAYITDLFYNFKRSGVELSEPTMANTMD